MKGHGFFKKVSGGQSPRSRGHDTGLTAIFSVHFDYLHSFIYTYYTYMYIYMYVQKSK